MKERPILFQGDLVRAILAGTKTVTITHCPACSAALEYDVCAVCGCDISEPSTVTLAAKISEQEAEIERLRAGEKALDCLVGRLLTIGGWHAGVEDALFAAEDWLKGRSR